MSELLKLQNMFNTSMTDYINKCIPLSVKDNRFVYFLSPSDQFYGFDLDKKLIFEPSSTNKYKLVTECIDLYFTDDVKNACETTIGVKFETLTELVLRKTYQEKHIGKKFFFSQHRNCVYIWDMVTSQWKNGEPDKIKYMFSNGDVMQIENSQVKSYVSSKETTFSELGINIDDLEELDIRFKDGSIHYLHKLQNIIYSCNIFGNYWYVPGEAVQTKIISHIKKEADVDN